jgi:hypothetical protein
MELGDVVLAGRRHHSRIAVSSFGLQTGWENEVRVFDYGACPKPQNRSSGIHWCCGDASGTQACVVDLFQQSPVSLVDGEKRKTGERSTLKGPSLGDI